MELREDVQYRMANGQVVGPLVEDEDGCWSYGDGKLRELQFGDGPDYGYIPMWHGDGRSWLFGVDAYNEHMDQWLRIVEEAE